MTVRLALGGLFETQLRSEPERELHQVYRTDESLIEVQATISVAQLLARPSDLAVDAAIEILSAFGLDNERWRLGRLPGNLVETGARLVLAAPPRR